MNNKKKDFIQLLEDLCFIYRDYLNRYNDSRVDVNINDNMIKIELFKGNELMDEFGLSFTQKEKSSYMYISFVLMKNLFGSKMIYSKNNMFYNDKDNIRVNVLDNDLFDRMFDMLNIYRTIDFYERIDNGRRVRNKINKDKTIKFMDERINITKHLLKVREK